MILIISGLTLHSRFFIKTQSNAFVKFDKIVNPKKKTFLISLKYLHLHYIILFHQIIMNVFNIINCNNIIIINTKIINIASESILSVDQSFEILPRHNGLGTMLESFPLNFIISVPLTSK